MASIINSVSSNSVSPSAGSGASARAREILKMQIMAQLGAILAELINTQSEAAQKDAEQDKDLERKAQASAAMEHLADTLVDAVMASRSGASQAAPIASSNSGASVGIAK